MLVRYMLSSCLSDRLSVCLSVLLPVRPKHDGIVPKRLNIGSRKQRHTTDRVWRFLMPKISAKFKRGHPQWGRQMGRLKVAIFEQYRAISQKRCKIAT